VYLTLSAEAKDAYWAAAVSRTEEMLDGIYMKIKADSSTRGGLNGPIGRGFYSSTFHLILSRFCH
jgi:hypothetical protein